MSEVDGGVQGAMRASQGRPREGAPRRILEEHFGEDLSRVQVHTDAMAAAAARALQAKAFTLGEKIYFGEGFYAPTPRPGCGSSRTRRPTSCKATGES